MLSGEILSRWNILAGRTRPLIGGNCRAVTSSGGIFPGGILSRWDTVGWDTVMESGVHVPNWTKGSLKLYLF